MISLSQQFQRLISLSFAIGLTTFALLSAASAYTLTSDERSAVDHTWEKVIRALDYKGMSIHDFIGSIEVYLEATNLHETKLALFDRLIELAFIEDEERRLLAYGFDALIPVNDSSEALYVQANGIPTNHTVDMDADCDDRNNDGRPDRAHPVEQQEFSFVLPHDAEMAKRPYEIDKEIGVALNGVLIYGPRNDQGSFAEVSDVLDACGGQPDKYGKYHYHGLSPCLGVSPTDLIGYAFDGHKIYNYLEPDGEQPVYLDSCNGHRHTSEEPYHYHAYSGDHTQALIGCFRSQPVWSNFKQGEEGTIKDLCKDKE